MLILHEATLLAAVPEARMADPHSGSDNTPTVSWITREALVINPVVVDLLRIRVLRPRQFYLNPSVFIAKAKKIVWRMMLLVFSIFLTPHSSFTYLPHTCSHKVCGRSPSRRRICFIVWSQRCAGSRAIRNYSICATAEALLAVEQILLHPAD